LEGRSAGVFVAKNHAPRYSGYGPAAVAGPIGKSRPMAGAGERFFFFENKSGRGSSRTGGRVGSKTGYTEGGGPRIIRPNENLNKIQPRRAQKNQKKVEDLCRGQRRKKLGKTKKRKFENAPSCEPILKLGWAHLPEADYWRPFQRHGDSTTRAGSSLIGSAFLPRHSFAISFEGLYCISNCQCGSPVQTEQPDKKVSSPEHRLFG